ncbi:GNAT family N-acetyltransferase [Alkaliphilus transvaalensis]|uniref:GNAT family N-acetyltransferase n=1 Tax=Alkaliphilus transvaalensis TaxID=114628 RepID=UPI000478C208|nr:GNAT family N-acetyltransferase [Alkaliphilus transvaalensis]
MDAIKFIEVNDQLKGEWMKGSQWSEAINERVIHTKKENGFSIIAEYNHTPAGIISIKYQELINPLEDLIEAYIDNIEVKNQFRNKGIATALIKRVFEIINVKQPKPYQVRAWSTIDKVEMLNLWKKLGFCFSSTSYLLKEGREIKGYYLTKKI